MAKRGYQKVILALKFINIIMDLILITFHLLCFSHGF